MPQKEELHIGDKVFYSLEDMNTGEDVIYEGEVLSINNHVLLKIGDKEIETTFYYVSEGLGMQRNSLYTLKDLFKIKEWAEEVNQSLYEK